MTAKPSTSRPPSSPSSANATDLPCPPSRRLLALLYDLLVMLAIMLVLGYVSQRLTGGRLLDQQGRPRVWWYQPLQGTALAVYLLSSWRRGGQTLGMRPWRLRLRRLDGRRVHWNQLLRRLAVAASPLWLLPLARPYGVAVALWAMLAAWVVCYATSLVDPRRRTLQDLAAGTWVICLHQPVRVHPAG